MEFLGKLLSCFVCERKHRATKRCALFVFRSIDNTVIKDMLNRQCTQIASGNQSLYSRQFLASPSELVIGDNKLLHSTQAVLPCGTVFDGDLVWLGSLQTVGGVIGFWQPDGSTEIAVRLEMYESVGDPAHYRWDMSNKHIRTVSSADIFDTVSYLPLGGDVVRVVPPVRAFVHKND